MFIQARDIGATLGPTASSTDDANDSQTDEQDDGTVASAIPDEEHEDDANEHTEPEAGLEPDLASYTDESSTSHSMENGEQSSVGVATRMQELDGHKFDGHEDGSDSESGNSSEPEERGRSLGFTALQEQGSPMPGWAHPSAEEIPNWAAEVLNMSTKHAGTERRKPGKADEAGQAEMSTKRDDEARPRSSEDDGAAQVAFLRSCVPTKADFEAVRTGKQSTDPRMMLARAMLESIERGEAGKERIQAVTEARTGKGKTSANLNAQKKPATTEPPPEKFESDTRTSGRKRQATAKAAAEMSATKLPTRKRRATTVTDNEQEKKRDRKQ